MFCFNCCFFCCNELSLTTDKETIVCELFKNYLSSALIFFFFNWTKLSEIIVAIWKTILLFSKRHMFLIVGPGAWKKVQMSVFCFSTLCNMARILTDSCLVLWCCYGETKPRELVVNHRITSYWLVECSCCWFECSLWFVVCGWGIHCRLLNRVFVLIHAASFIIINLSGFHLKRLNVVNINYVRGKVYPSLYLFWLVFFFLSFFL